MDLCYFVSFYLVATVVKILPIVSTTLGPTRASSLSQNDDIESNLTDNVTSPRSWLCNGSAPCSDTQSSINFQPSLNVTETIVDSFLVNHRKLPETYINTSTNTEDLTTDKKFVFVTDIPIELAQNPETILDSNFSTVNLTEHELFESFENFSRINDAIYSNHTTKSQFYNASLLDEHGIPNSTQMALMENTYSDTGNQNYSKHFTTAGSGTSYSGFTVVKTSTPSSTVYYSLQDFMSSSETSTYSSTTSSDKSSFDMKSYSSTMGSGFLPEYLTTSVPVSDETFETTIIPGESRSMSSDSTDAFETTILPEEARSMSFASGDSSMTTTHGPKSSRLHRYISTAGVKYEESSSPIFPAIAFTSVREVNSNFSETTETSFPDESTATTVLLSKSSTELETEKTTNPELQYTATVIHTWSEEPTLTVSDVPLSSNFEAITSTFEHLIDKAETTKASSTNSSATSITTLSIVTVEFTEKMNVTFNNGPSTTATPLESASIGDDIKLNVNTIPPYFHTTEQELHSSSATTFSTSVSNHLTTNFDSVPSATTTPLEVSSITDDIKVNVDPFSVTLHVSEPELTSTPKTAFSLSGVLEPLTTDSGVAPPTVAAMFTSTDESASSAELLTTISPTYMTDTTSIHSPSLHETEVHFSTSTVTERGTTSEISVETSSFVTDEKTEPTTARTRNPLLEPNPTTEFSPYSHDEATIHYVTFSETFPYETTEASDTTTIASTLEQTFPTDLQHLPFKSVNSNDLTVQNKVGVVTAIFSKAQQIYGNDWVGNYTAVFHIWVIETVIRSMKNSSLVWIVPGEDVGQPVGACLPEFVYVSPTPTETLNEWVFTFLVRCPSISGTLSAEQLLPILVSNADKILNILSLNESNFVPGFFEPHESDINNELVNFGEIFDNYGSIIIAVPALVLLVLLARLICLVHKKRRSRSAIHCITDRDKLDRDMHVAVEVGDINSAVVILQDEMQEKGAEKNGKIFAADENEVWVVPINQMPVEEEDAPNVQDTKL